MAGAGWGGNQSHHSQRDWPTEEDFQKNNCIQWRRQTDGHCNLETESAKWADSVNIIHLHNLLTLVANDLFSVSWRL